MRGVPVAPQARSMGPGPSLPPSANPGASSNGLLPTHAPIDMLPSQWSAVAGPDGTPILQTSSSNLYDGGTPLETSLHLANSIDSDGRSLPRHHRSGSHFSYYVEPPFPQDGARQQPTQGIAALREGGYRSAVEVGLITEAESRLLFQK
jgi:hypothetical protein